MTDAVEKNEKEKYLSEMRAKIGKRK